MLVLTRKIGEKLLIGDDIVITLTSIRTMGQARIGIKAPRDMLVRRLKPDGTFEEGQKEWRVEKLAGGEGRGASNE